MTVTDDKGAINKDTVKVTVALARLSRETSRIKAYPNPVQDITTVEINTEKSNTNVMILITNVSGESVYKKEFVSSLTTMQEKIDMSTFIQGAYVISVLSDGGEMQSIKALKL